MAAVKKKTPARKPRSRTKPAAGAGRCVNEYVEWSYIKDVGRGVVARKAARKGTVLERSPVVVAPARDFVAKHGRMTVIDNYLLTWPEKRGDREYAVGLGYLMLYNHADDPNAEFRYLFKRREIEMVALRSIRKGEEITHDYGGDGPWFVTREERAAKAKKRRAK